MKLYSVIFLLAILVLGTVGNWGIYLAFKINQQYISKVLCENKEVPQMQCAGKCYLKKQLSEATDTASSEPTSIQRLPELQLAIVAITEEFFWMESTLLIAHRYTSSPLLKGYKHTIEHPPAIG